MSKSDWKEIDLNGAFIKEHTISTKGNEWSIRKTISFCEENNIRHDVYEKDCALCVIWQHGHSTVEVYGKDDNDNYAVLEFKNVLEWHQIIQKVHNSSIVYPFYVLHIKDYAVVLNLKTLRFIPISNESRILPMDFTFHRNCYERDKTQLFMCDYMEHLWIDNILYNDKLIECVSLYKDYKLLDIHYYYIAVDDNMCIRIFRLNPEYRGKFTLIDVPYKCYSRGIYDSACLFLDETISYSVNWYAPFNVLSGKFAINIEKIQSEYKNRKRVYIEDDYDLINDGLDGEADAYWNID